LFVFLLQVRHAIVDNGPIYLFAVFSAIVWLLWIVKVVLSRRYRPWTQPYQTTTTVVVPVVDEPVDLFRDVLGRIVAQQPDEVVVVINGPRNTDLEDVCDELAVSRVWTSVPGKRNAVRLGVEHATGEIVVLVDSDTVWTEKTLPELVKPFADPGIGGVTTRQRILDYDRNLLTRWSDWLENSRALYAMPAQSVLGQVGCLPGRTIAFRRELLVKVMPGFLTGRFLGVFLEVSDDRTLTNLALRSGYRTVYQFTSLVYTDSPTGPVRLFRQQLRWARGSQYNTLRMLPWMLTRAPLLAVFFLADIALPFLLVGATIGWVYRGTTHTGVNFYAATLEAYGMQSGVLRVVALAVVASMMSMGIRQLRHLSERPGDFFWMPVFVLLSTLFLMPVRLIGFFRMAHVSGWGTRQHAYAGNTTTDASPTTVTVAGPPAGPSVHIGHNLTGPPLARTALAHTIRSTIDGPVSERGSGARPPGRWSRQLNPWAAIPYLIGAAVIALEVLHHA
jgi:cellulose synthase/poly-beta-1,6-N-acetylglucosamine synthase-like glycosyltransferase